MTDPSLGRPALELRERRDLGQVLNATFQFIRENLRGLVRPLLYYALPVAALAGLASGSALVGMFSSIGADIDPAGGGGDPSVAATAAFSFLSMVGSILSAIATFLASVIVYAFVALYVRRGAGAYDYGDVWRLAKARFWPMLGVTFVIGIIVVVPAVVLMLLVAGAFSAAGAGAVVLPCLALPALVAYIVWAATVFAPALPIQMMEDPGLGETLRRSRALVRDHFWLTFGVIAVTAIIFYVINAVFTMPAMLVGVVGGVLGGSGNVLLGAATMVLALAGTILSTLTYMIPLVATAVHYFNLSERKERTGLMARIEAMEEGAEGAPEGSVSGPPAPSPAYAPPASPEVPPAVERFEAPHVPELPPERPDPSADAIERLARVLDVAPDAPPAEVRAQYERLREEAERERLHALGPTRQAQVEEKVRALDEAYDTLMRLRGDD